MKIFIIVLSFLFFLALMESPVIAQQYCNCNDADNMFCSNLITFCTIDYGDAATCLANCGIAF